jgi:hypothetical protein
MNTALQLYTPPKAINESLFRWLDSERHHFALSDVFSFEWLRCEMRDDRRRRRPSLGRALREARKAGFNVTGVTIEDDKITLKFADGSQATAASDNPWEAAEVALRNKRDVR